MTRQAIQDRRTVADHLLALRNEIAVDNDVLPFTLFHPVAEKET